MSPRASSGSSPGGTDSHEERTARLGDAVHEFHARRIQARRVAELRERHERPGDLGGDVDPLGWIDADAPAVR